MHELAQDDDLGLLSVAPVELQHLADDAVDALRVVADHPQQSRARRRDGAVLLEELRRLVDGRKRIAHLVRDRCRQPAQRRELHLLRLVLRAAEVFEVDQGAPVQARTDADQPHAQQPLRRIHLEWRQGLRVVLLPAAPVVVQRRAEFRQAHAAPHPAESTQKPGHLGVMTAHDSIEVDDEHAVLHVLDDQPVDLFEIRDVDAALRRELFGRLRVPSERHGDADRGEIAKSDESRLERLGAADATFEHAPDVQPQQDEARDRGVKKRRLRAQQPAAGGELRKEQDRQRAAGAAAGDHHQRDADDVAGEQCRHERRQAHGQRLALDDPERGETEDEVDRGRCEKCVRRRDAENAEVEQQRRPEQRGTADCAIDADNPQDPAARFRLCNRQRRLPDRWRERRC